jgi:hypothetical protein
MSFFVFLTTLAIEIYMFIYLINDVSTFIRSFAIMVYSILFLILGAVMDMFSQKILLFNPIASVISLFMAGMSLFYYSQDMNWYEYIFISLSLPFLSIFWCIVRTFSKKRPIFKINSIILMYIFIYLPIMVYVLNSF